MSQGGGTALAGFGTRLFSDLCQATPSANVVLSPLVVAGALSLAAAGATPGGSAESELLGALGFSAHTDFSALLNVVLSGEGASVRAASGIFTKATIKPDYVDLVKTAYDANASQLGSTFAPINSWVEQKTEGYITDLLQDPPDPLLVAVLVSCVFFKGSWAAKFDPVATVAATFTLADDNTVQTLMMHRTGEMAASSAVESLEGAAAVRLDYGGGETSEEGDSKTADYCALFVLPREEGPEGIVAAAKALASASPLAVLSELQPQSVALAMPKVKATYGTASLTPALRNLGIVAAFDGSDGFNVMSDDPDVHIGDVLTKAILEVDEEGTVAAAAAASLMMMRSLPPPPLELTFDRPFILAILHIPTGAPLFLALLNEPASA